MAEEGVPQASFWHHSFWGLGRFYHVEWRKDLFVECHSARLGSFIFELYLPSLGSGLFLIFRGI
jgi:hypothetical protein